MIPRDSLIALGRTFRALNMPRHVEQLTAYYRSNQGNVPPYGWDDAHVLGWMRRLRIPPYEAAIPVQPKGSTCPECGPQSVFGGTRTSVTFPGGYEFICGRCGELWLELDGGPDERRIEA